MTEDYFIPTDEDRENFKRMEQQWEKEEYDIKELVKDNVVRFDSYRQGFFYYNLYNPNKTPNGETYQFPVPIDDIGTATMLAHDRAITYMRWIRKAINDKTLIKVK